MQASLADRENVLTKYGEAMAFKYFLQEWQVDLVDKYLPMYLSKDSREYLSIFFLLDKRPLEVKKSELKARLGSEEDVFADFVIAEHYLKDGEWEKAGEIYQRLFDKRDIVKTNDDWIIKESRVRLRELEVRDK